MAGERKIKAPEPGPVRTDNAETLVNALVRIKQLESEVARLTALAAERERLRLACYAGASGINAAVANASKWHGADLGNRLADVRDALLAAAATPAPKETA